LSSLTIQQQNTAFYDDSTIVIQMLSAGICGTDLAMLSGNRVCRAAVLGHEGVGVVRYAPEDCTMSKGDRVIINPVHRKNPHLVVGHSYDGVFREMFCIDAALAADGGLLVACPAGCSVADTELALAEPLASVLYSLELLRGGGGSSLLIRGSGTVGILAAMLWSKSYESSVVLVSKSEGHAQWLRESIIWPTNVRICSTNNLTRVAHDCPAPGFNAAILCCSREDAAAGLGSLLDAIQDGATIDLMAGFPGEYEEARLGGINLDAIRWNNICGTSTAPPSVVTDHDTGKTIHLVGHRGTSPQHILQAIDLLSHGVVSIADIPHYVLSLPEVPDVVSQMLSSQTRQNAKWVKAIIDFSREYGGGRTGTL
jgi:threonine dehydrogenase-like Zn-dependent dehydrogenase